MLPKFRVLGDSSANPFFSSSVIVNGLNNGARKIGLFDENGIKIVYSTTANDYGHQDAAIIDCLYEFSFPMPILQNLNGRPCIGNCIDNMFFAKTGGYPSNLIGYVPLGVDTEVFTPQKRTGNKDVFRFLSFAESNTRCGLDTLIQAFGELFSGRKDVELYIKDRNPTPIFVEYVQKQAEHYNIIIIHNTENTQDHDTLRKIYSDADAHVFVNNSSTWALTCVESMACGLPLIAMNYSGPNNYLRDNFNGLEVDYDLEPVTDALIQSLIAKGMKNFIFSNNSHITMPFWAKPKIESLKQQLFSIFKADKNQLSFLGNNAILTANQFTWSRAATLLSYQLLATEWNKNNPNLIRNLERY